MINHENNKENNTRKSFFNGKSQEVKVVNLILSVSSKFVIGVIVRKKIKIIIPHTHYYPGFFSYYEILV